MSGAQQPFVPELEGSMTAVVDAPRITATLLEQLDRGEMLAVRIPAFVPETHAQEMARNVVGHWSLSVYRNTPELMRIGQSHYETHEPSGEPNAAALDDYLDKADLLMEEIRTCCAPYRSPLDRLWEMLDEEMGAERVRIHGRPMFAGIVRVFPEGRELLPHNDRFARDAPYLDVAKAIQAQFALNIYLQVPPKGGELQLWAERLTDDELSRMQMRGSKYGVDPAKAPPPRIEIHPRVGDVVVIDATRLHAVKPSCGGIRVGMSCFLAYRRHSPLLYWS